MELTVLHLLGIALGLGLLVGFEREWSKNPVAGIRTYPLITVLGLLAALLADHFGGWVVAAGLLAVAAMVLLGSYTSQKAGEIDPGITSEITALLMYAIGAALAIGYTAEAVVVAGTVAVLLHLKEPLHRLVGRVAEPEVRAVIRFVLLAMVILPLLPNRGYGPYEVLNPFGIWLMVVLIVGISLGAYLASLAFGEKAGTLVTGLLGGMISSTATTVGYARWARGDERKTGTAALVIMIASTAVFIRVLVEIAIVAPQVLADTAGPLGAVMGWFAAVAAGGYFFLRRGLTRAAERGEPPSNLGAAIIFGALYAAVLVAVAFASEQFGQRGLYSVAALSGLTDMDAITLSSAQMIRAGTIESRTGWRMIVVGAMANLLFKSAVIGGLGGRKLLGHMAVLFALSFLGAAAVLMLWPD